MRALASVSQILKPARHMHHRQLQSIMHLDRTMQLGCVTQLNSILQLDGIMQLESVKQLEGVMQMDDSCMLIMLIMLITY